MGKNIELAPICLFVYSSLEETKLTVESLKKNILASKSELFIFSDGPKNEDSFTKVQDVREYIHTIDGFAKVIVYESTMNLGLSNSIISGVSKIISVYDKVIVLEDDLILSENFLCYMNQSLSYYKEIKRVLSVSGYSFHLKYPKRYTYDVAFSLRASSWGWATWKDRWESVDWDVKTYKSYRYNPLKRLKFNLGGSDMAHMLDNQMSGKINSWAIRFCYHQYVNNLLDVFPIVSKVTNIGFGNKATNTKSGYSRFRTILDKSNDCTFKLTNNLQLSVLLLSQFYWHFSITIRIVSRLKEILFNHRN